MEEEIRGWDGRVKKEMGERDCESSENKTPGHSEARDPLLF